MTGRASSAMNIVWVQPDGPNTVPKSIQCAAFDSVTIDLGGIDDYRIWDPQAGVYHLAGRRRDEPDSATFTLEELAGLTATELQRIMRRANCPVPIYVGTYECGPRVAFAGFDRMKVLEDCFMESETQSNLAVRDGQENMLDAFDFNAAHVEIAFRLATIEHEIGDTQTIRDIAICGETSCYGRCGPSHDACDSLVAVAEAALGFTAHVWYSADSGRTWTQTAADPFGIDEDIGTVVCFPLDQNTWRWLVGRYTSDIANPAEVAYSDDGGVTWTAVDVGTTNNDCMQGPGCLFAIDRYHIWACTKAGDIFFSNDGGESWQDQNSGNAISLADIVFLDEFRGCCVGASGGNNVLLTTDDGGARWNAINGIADGPGRATRTVTMHDRNTFWVGASSWPSNNLWYSNDGGATWAERELRLPSGGVFWEDIRDIDRYDRYIMFILANSNDGEDNLTTCICRTVNGGTDWQVYPFSEQDSQMLAMAVCHANRAVAVGDPSLAGIARFCDLCD